MTNFGAIYPIKKIGLPRASLYPQREDIHTYATIMSMKRGSKRESFRSLPETIIVNNRALPVRWVA